MKKQAEQHIIDNYGENWLKIDWDANDVIDIMIAFAKEKAEDFAKYLDERLLSENIYAEPWYLEDFEDWWKQKEKS